MDLFHTQTNDAPASASAPLAERMRPQTVEEYVGQGHLLGEDKPLSRLLSEGIPSSLIFWGPPGTGKTTLARLLAKHWRANFREFSAVLSGVADLRKVAEEARKDLRRGVNTVLFIDEIHRFNKAQQDAFLPHVEAGVVTLLGATTENPSFEIIPALLSRVRVLVLHPLEASDLRLILKRALSSSQGLADYDVELTPEAEDHLLAAAFGDARRMLGSLEVAALTAPLGAGGKRLVGLTLAEEAVGKKALRYDKAGEEHYNLISALHKSLRGSDPDAALYWLGRMLEAGESPHYLLRRMMRFASEDIGLADPYALSQVADALQAFDLLGLPEGNLALAQAAVYLALAPKSNALYKGWAQMMQDVREYGPLEVPLHIRNAPTRLMRELDYGKGYEYPHDYEDAVVGQEYMPDQLASRRYYKPALRGREKAISEHLRELAARKAGLRKKTKP